MNNRHTMFDLTFTNFSQVNENFRETLWNYFLYGLEPGSFTRCVLENNFYGAIMKAHPILTIGVLKELLLWLDVYAPKNSYGSEKTVNKWLSLSLTERRDIMIEHNLSPGVFDVLSGRQPA